MSRLVDPAEPLDESTLPSRRQSSREQAAGSQTAISARRRSGAEVPASIEPDDGSTIVVRRGVQAAVRDPAPVTALAAEVTGLATEKANRAKTLHPTDASNNREAESSDVQTYAVRKADPARVERAVPEPREHQLTPDSGAAIASRRRRRIRAAIVIFAASLGLVLAVAALTVLLSLNA